MLGSNPVLSGCRARKKAFACGRECSGDAVVVGGGAEGAFGRIERSFLKSAARLCRFALFSALDAELDRGDHPVFKSDEFFFVQKAVNEEEEKSNLRENDKSNTCIHNCIRLSGKIFYRTFVLFL